LVGDQFLVSLNHLAQINSLSLPERNRKEKKRGKKEVFFLKKKRLLTETWHIASVDHTPQPHPASPSGKLPAGFTGYGDGSNTSSKHSSFSTYRDHAQQFGPLQKTIRNGDAGIGGSSASELGPVTPSKGVFFDRSELPARFRRAPMTAAEMEAVESGGAALFG
jgi:small subunit ribosomal protein YMR-31